MNTHIKHVSPTEMVDELNQRAIGYYRSGMSVEDAIQQAVIDFRYHLAGIGYKILSEDEIEQRGFDKFFESYGMQS